MIHKEILLAKVGELALKGLNRSTFEAVLVKNIRRSLADVGAFEITRAQSTIYIEPADDSADLDEAVEKVSKIFGIVTLSRAGVCEKSMEEILEWAPRYTREALETAKTFKVEAKRADKRFPLKSPQISAAVGERLLTAFPHLTVDVHHPDVVVTVEVRDFGAYIRAGVIPGAGGMPIGTGGKAVLLLSGGIDSPVAAWMMAKRGVQLTAVHFASPPYTSERAELKVRELLKQLTEWCGSVRLIVVPFTRIQEDIRDKCPEEYSTLVMRRYMMRIACDIARQHGCGALVTGESLGQVASQTLWAIGCTDDAADLPVLRPLIGMDKEEIVAISRRIGTFDISIQPYEDCCTVFTPKHPRTRPTIADVEKAEAGMDDCYEIRLTRPGKEDVILTATH